MMRIDLQRTFSARQRIFIACEGVFHIGLIRLRVGYARIDRQRTLEKLMRKRKISPLRGNHPQRMKRIEVVGRSGEDVAIDTLCFVQFSRSMRLRCALQRVRVLRRL